MDAQRYTLPHVPSSEPDPVPAISWSDAELSPNADLTEARACAAHPDRMWTVLHAIEDTTQEPRGVEPWAVFVAALMLVIVVASFARC